MSKNPPFPPRRSGAARTVAFVLFPGFQILDAAGPIAAFEIASRFHAGAYKLRLYSTEGGMVASSSGVAMATERLKGARLTAIDTLIVVGGQGTRAAAQDETLLGALRRAAPRVRRMASVCSGAFLLAAAGLLDGKRATTHWESAGLLQKLFPRVKVDPDCIYVEDGRVWTSAGVTAGIDLGLAMITRDCGPDIARATAREMVVYVQRPGGQAQHSALLEIDRPGGRFAELHAFMRAHLHQDLSVERLAAEAAMSPRNFARAYAAETGVTPAKAVERLRLETARAALESGSARVQEIARKAGFGDSERMRRAFTRFYGAPPAALRRTLRRA